MFRAALTSVCTLACALGLTACELSEGTDEMTPDFMEHAPEVGRSFLKSADLAPDEDEDQDGLTNQEECDVGLDPFDADMDDDGLSDGEELQDFRTSPLDPDSDGDGVQDGTEVGRTLQGTGPGTSDDFVPDQDPDSQTNPLDPDSDDDGVRDGVEDADGNGRVDPGESDPLNPTDAGGCITPNDCDNDGLDNDFETRIGTAVDNPDTDGDGLTDAFEVGRGSDPLVRDELPEAQEEPTDPAPSESGCSASGPAGVPRAHSLLSSLLALLLMMGLAKPRVLLRAVQAR